MSENHSLKDVVAGIFSRIASLVKGNGRIVAAAVIAYGLFYAAAALLGVHVYVLQLFFSCVAALSLFCMFVPAFNGEELSFKNAVPDKSFIFSAAVLASLLLLIAIFVFSVMFASALVSMLISFFLKTNTANVFSAPFISAIVRAAAAFAAIACFFVMVFAAMGIAAKEDVVYAVQNALSLLAKNKLLLLGSAAVIALVKTFLWPHIFSAGALFADSHSAAAIIFCSAVFAPFCIFLAALHSALVSESQAE
ncbi:MAG: hypothetical protein FWC57_02665 [Endomicrobia bacterium]|nr:hypothetical protein [Endomicrobiia bacterium]